MIIVREGERGGGGREREGEGGRERGREGGREGDSYRSVSLSERSSSLSSACAFHLL